MLICAKFYPTVSGNPVMSSATRFQRYLLPGLVFQSVIVGGGYATGRELVEFFVSKGPLGGILGMLLAMIIWSLVLAVSFELARITRSYDYLTFFRHLLGRGWVLFEIPFCALIIVSLAVLGSATGTVLTSHFAIPNYTGTLLLALLIGTLTFYGTGLIEKVFASWSLVLYCAYITLFIWCWISFGESIKAGFAKPLVTADWYRGGLVYAGINIAAIPAILFSLRHLQSRHDAICSGLMAGPIAMIPALLFYTLMIGHYPAITHQTVPLTYILDQLNSQYFGYLFQIIILGTFIETGTALIHSLNERIAVMFNLDERSMTAGWWRPATAVTALILSVFLATKIGLVRLIAEGFGTLTYAFLFVFVLPVMSIGLWKIYQASAYPRRNNA